MDGDLLLHLSHLASRHDHTGGIYGGDGKSDSQQTPATSHSLIPKCSGQTQSTFAYVSGVSGSDGDGGYNGACSFPFGDESSIGGYTTHPKVLMYCTLLD